MPVRIVSDGVVTRSVRDTAAFYREAEKVYRDLRAGADRRHHPPRPAPGSRSPWSPSGVGVEATPEVPS